MSTKNKRNKVVLNKTREKGVYWYETKTKGKLFMYRHRYYDSSGKRREVSERGFTSINQAIRALLDVKNKLNDGNTKQVENRNLTVEQLINIYYDANKNNWKISTQKVRKNIYDNWIIPYIGERKLRELSNVDVYKRVFIDRISEHLEDSTVKSINTLFTIAMNYAVQNGYISSHGLKSVFRLEYVKSDNYYTNDELKVFEKRAKKTLCISGYTFLLLLSRTGLRRGEAMGLTWEGINFDDKSVSVELTRDRYGARKPKTIRSLRTVNIDDELLHQLKRYRKWCIETKFMYKAKHEVTDFVFITDYNEPIHECSATQWLKQMYSEYSTMKTITVHGLRHSHASMLINDGVPPVTIAERLGNTPSMIERVYGHTYVDQDRDCAARIAKLLS